MQLRCRLVVLLSGWLIATAAVRAEDAALRFCVTTNALPRAGKTEDGALDGVDVAFAELLAKQLGRRCEFHSCASDACRLKNLKAGQCDVVIGLPHESESSSELIWTRPYASDKFGLLVSKSENSIRTLVELRDKRVGIVAGTVPLSPKEHLIVSFPSTKSLLRDFEQSKLAGAIVDVDFAAWYLSTHPEIKLRLVDEFVSTQRWNIGMALRAKDAALRDELSRAVENCLRQAQLRPLFAKYGLTHRPPSSDENERPTEIVHDTWQRIQAGEPLVVSMDPANLPYSSADPEQPGSDVEIAQALANVLGVKLQINWIDVHRETAIGELLEHECDLAFGAAVDPHAMDDEEALAGKVCYSRSYYGTGYFLVARDDAPPIKALTDLQGEKSRRLGTQAGTIADYSLRQRGYFRRLFGTQLAVLTALENGAIDYAYLWSNSGWLLHQSPEIKAKLISDYVPEEHWNIAVAMRHGDSALKEQVDRALDQVMRAGKVAAALQRYHVPNLPPFETETGSEEKPASEQTGRLPPVDRGIEPQMSRRQVSRATYDGLARVRSRGTLIVGLDQNNLPFSTAHPDPAGLDYDVAQLLAKQLGVSLEVYWAYSSHDSYPSKLAHKKVCDVMLGVMPDDRFADQVAFSEPYYFAGYEYATPVTGAKANMDALPIAAESGIAVRGLADRRVQTYSNLESILAAVATGEVPAGYVMSSRAHWLAEQKWPGSIRFMPTGTAVDRFDICAAVRRNEPDLRDAVNEAFQKLRETGELQQAFTRWHVPLD